MKHLKLSSNISAIREVRRLSNELRSNLCSKETKRIRKKLYKKETASICLKEKEHDSTLTNRKKHVIKNITRCIKNISIHLKNYGKHLNKIQKHQYCLD